MQVYVVTFGGYSDSYVGGVYTDRDNADAAARANDGYVESMELDPPLSEAEQRYLRPGEHIYSVSMNVDGSGAQASEVWSVESGVPELRVRVDSNNVPRSLSAICWARSEEHAIEILNDRRSQWLAMGALVGGGYGRNLYWHTALLMPAEVV